MVIIGTTEQELLSRLFSGSLVYDVVNEVDSSMLLCERRRSRSFRQQLFGARIEGGTPDDDGEVDDDVERAD